MNKTTKSLLTIGGIAIFGYLVYRQFRNEAMKKNFLNASGLPKFQLTQETLAIFTDRQVPQSFKLKTGDILFVNWRTILNGIPTGYTRINGREATFPLSAGRFVY
jgi:hypothetical protein